MTEQETAAVLTVIKAGLPNAYLKLTDADAQAMVAMWAEMFADYPGDLVMAAAKTYIWNDTTGRFPAPGAIREHMQDIQRVVKQCSYGSTVQEYMGGAAAERFPVAVRAYIDSAAGKCHMELFGTPFKSQAQKLEEHRQRQLTAGGTGHDRA